MSRFLRKERDAAKAITVDLVKTGLTIAEASKELEITPRTVERWRKSDPTFDSALKDARTIREADQFGRLSRDRKDHPPKRMSFIERARKSLLSDDRTAAKKALLEADAETQVTALEGQLATEQAASDAAKSAAKQFRASQKTQAAQRKKLNDAAIAVDDALKTLGKAYTEFEKLNCENAVRTRGAVLSALKFHAPRLSKFLKLFGQAGKGHPLANYYSLKNEEALS